MLDLLLGTSQEVKNKKKENYDIEFVQEHTDVLSNNNLKKMKEVSKYLRNLLRKEQINNDEFQVLYEHFCALYIEKEFEERINEYFNKSLYEILIRGVLKLNERKE